CFFNYALMIRQDYDITSSLRRGALHQARPNHGIQDEGQAGPNHGVQDGGQAGSNPGDAKDKEFTTTAYLNVQENVKLPSEDLVIPKEPASSTGTLSSLQNLEKELSFADQFFMKKQQEEKPGKTNAEAEVKSMVSVPVHQDTSLVPLMITPVIDLMTSQSGSPIPTSSATTSTVMTTRTILSPPPQPQQSTAYPTLMKRIDELEQHMEILQQWMFKDKSYKAHEDHKKLYDAMEKSLERDYSDQLLSDVEEAYDSIPDKQWKPLPAEKRPTTPEPTWTIPFSNVSDVKNNWAIALALTYETPAKNSLLAKARDMTNFLNWYCHQVNKTKLTQAGLEGQAYEVDWTNPEGDQVRIDVNRPLPLNGSSGHVTIQLQFFFNKDLEYLRHGSKGSSPALLISKMKAASYPNFGLELLVPEQIVVKIKAYSRYGYDYLSEIVLQRVDLQEHTIAEKDFKNMHPSDFEDLNLLLLRLKTKRIYQNLECFVGGRVRDIDYRLL
nr:hypothetical protein [Tanacetum cinerariifolium]